MFLEEPASSAAVDAMYAADQDDHGYVMNVSRVWAHQPSCQDAFFGLIDAAAEAGSLSFRQRGVLVAATASTRRDSYCSLAWGTRLAAASDPETAAAVLRGTDEGLDDQERALAAWARAVVRDPNGTTPDDVRALRDAGFDDAQIAGITLFVVMRLAFSTFNTALGAQPDRELGAAAFASVAAAVDYGRPVDS